MFLSEKTALIPSKNGREPLFLGHWHETENAFP